MNVAISILVISYRRSWYSISYWDKNEMNEAVSEIKHETNVI